MEFVSTVFITGAVLTLIHVADSDLRISPMARWGIAIGVAVFVPFIVFPTPALSSLQSPCPHSAVLCSIPKDALRSISIRADSRAHGSTTGYKHRRPERPPTEKPSKYRRPERPPTEKPSKYRRPERPPTEKPSKYRRPERPPTEKPSKHKDEDRRPERPPTEKPSKHRRPKRPPTEKPSKHKDEDRRPKRPPTEKPSKHKDEDRRPKRPPTEKDRPTAEPTAELSHNPVPPPCLDANGNGICDKDEPGDPHVGSGTRRGVSDRDGGVTPPVPLLFAPVAKFVRANWWALILIGAVPMRALARATRRHTERQWVGKHVQAVPHPDISAQLRIHTAKDEAGPTVIIAPRFDTGTQSLHEVTQ
jgi:hypothetical protein